jgi:hypothetical protein
MKLHKIFIYSAGGILLTAALMRFVIAADTTQVLALPDPVLFLPLRYALVLVGGIELVAALICLFGKNLALQTSMLAFLSMNYFVYQIGLYIMHLHCQTTCLGSLTDPLHLTHSLIGSLSNLLPIYLLAGSCGCYLWLWKEEKKKPKTYKNACPQCGQHIQYTSELLGKTIPCPNCQHSLNLQTTLRA